MINVIEMIFRTVDLTSREINRIDRSIGALARSFKILGAAVAAAGIGSFLEAQIEKADKIGDIAARIGVATEEVSRLGAAAELTDSSLDAVTQAMQYLGRQGLDQTTVINGVATSLRKTELAALPLNEAFIKILESIRKLPTEAEQLDALAKFFGRGSVELQNIVKDLDNFKKRMAETNDVVSQAQADAADRLDKAQTRLVQNLGALVRVSFLEPLAAFFDTVDKLKPALDKIDSIGLGVIKRHGGKGSADQQAVDEASMFFDAVAQTAPNTMKDAGKTAIDKLVEGMQEEADAKKKAAAEAAAKAAAEAASKVVNDAIHAGEVAAKAARDSALDTIKGMEDDLAGPLARINRKLQEDMELLDHAAFAAPELADRIEALRSEVKAAAKDQIDNLGKVTEQAVKSVSEFALEARRNTQDAFADFLFGIGEAEDGLKGLLRSFIDVVRRMAAEAVSAKIFDSLFGGATGAGFFGKLLGAFTGGATGSPVPTPGLKAAHGLDFTVPGFGGTDSRMVAFAATPGEHVSVGRQGGSGGPAIVFQPGSITLDARGADPMSSARLVASIPMLKRVLGRALAEDIRRGTLGD